MTARGKFVLTLLILGLAGFGTWKWWNKLAPTSLKQASATVNWGPAANPNKATPPATDKAAAATVSPLVAETETEVPKLPQASAFQPKDNVVLLELSEYAGYAGLIVANGGMEPSENSVFFKKHGFKVKITLSEEESWPALNTGKIAASATTVDVLPLYGRQFQVVVPAQIGFSRGADGVVVRKDIKRINHLKGRVLATSQFTEADFFIRYLAQEAGLGIHMLSGLSDTPDAEKLNLVYCKDAFSAGDLFLKDIKEDSGVLAGCVTWAPKTSEVAQQSGGKASVLATSVNLLIIADILVVNKGFAQQHPEMVAGLVEGLIEGNRQVRENQSACLDTVAKAFKWDREKAKAELGKVHLSNLPENQAFFSGSIDSAGSYSGIYQSAVIAYGNSLIKDPVDGDRFLELKNLKTLADSGAYKDQKVAIAPIRMGGGTSPEDPLLSKDIRFLFEPNSFSLRIEQKENQKNLEAIKQLLQVSPGSTILLRGHVDNGMVDEFRKKGGDTFVRQMALKALELSKNRAGEIKRLLIERYQIDGARIETVGRGWEEPSGTDNEQNRRVETQWFTLE
jgi:NitT/TauT family transport system substrate-binding protein